MKKMKFSDNFTKKCYVHFSMQGYQLYKIMSLIDGDEILVDRVFQEGIGVVIVLKKPSMIVEFKNESVVIKRPNENYYSIYSNNGLDYVLSKKVYFNEKLDTMVSRVYLRDDIVGVPGLRSPQFFYINGIYHEIKNMKNYDFINSHIKAEIRISDLLDDAFIKLLLNKSDEIKSMEELYSFIRKFAQGIKLNLVISVDYDNYRDELEIHDNKLVHYEKYYEKDKEKRIIMWRDNEFFVASNKLPCDKEIAFAKKLVK